MPQQTGSFCCWADILKPFSNSKDWTSQHGSNPLTGAPLVATSFVTRRDQLLQPTGIEAMDEVVEREDIANFIQERRLDCRYQGRAQHCVAGLPAADALGDPSGSRSHRRSGARGARRRTAACTSFCFYTHAYIHLYINGLRVDRSRPPQTQMCPRRLPQSRCEPRFVALSQIRTMNPEHDPKWALSVQQHPEASEEGRA